MLYSSLDPIPRRPVRRGLAYALGLVLAVLVASGCGDGGKRAATPTVGQSDETTTAARAAESARVLRVIDGDTILVEIGGRQERVRYIGVDTPETVAPDLPVECFGQEASAANRALVEGKTVRLEKDISDRDRFGRLLRYVYVDGVLVNAALVQRGYATAVTFPPDVRESERFRALEREAREAGRGLWSACGR